MSSAHAPATAAGEHDHGHAHPPHLAHHFDTPGQQFEAAKMGMWVFLATELLMFGGLFCAYAVYRANHPEVFQYAHHFLDRSWGAINTVVLLVSSFTMAWGVRAAQLGQTRLLSLLLGLTFLGGVGFMCIKTIEYQAKFSHDLAPGVYNLYQGVLTGRAGVAGDIEHLEHEYGIGGTAHGPATPHVEEGEQGGVSHAGAEPIQPTSVNQSGDVARADAPVTAPGVPAAPGDPAPSPLEERGWQNPVDHSVIEPAAQGPAGVSEAVIEQDLGDRTTAGHELGGHGLSFESLDPEDRQRVSIFFSIYFLMTGLHGIHVLIGMGLIAWIFFRSLKSHFGPAYFTPVDIVGLYWHLVDLIWIFLFPLLYLIH